MIDVGQDKCVLDLFVLQVFDSVVDIARGDVDVGDDLLHVVEPRLIRDLAVIALVDVLEHRPQLVERLGRRLDVTAGDEIGRKRDHYPAHRARPGEHPKVEVVEIDVQAVDDDDIAERIVVHCGVCDIERFSLAVQPLQFVAHPSFEHVRGSVRVKTCVAALFEHIVGDQSSVCGKHADPDQRGVDLVDASDEFFL